jgi:WD40 repeat protein
MTLFCSPFRSVELFVRVADPVPWIIVGCLLDCIFLYCYIITSHRKLNGYTDRVISIAFSPDGTKIASGSDNRSVRTWDAATGRQL